MKHRSVFMAIAIIAIVSQISLYAQTAPPADREGELSNSMVVSMLQDGLSPEIVIAKIRVSKNRFDTSPASMQELKKASVPDTVILAMVEAQGSMRSGVAAERTSSEVRVPDGVEMEVELSRNLSGQIVKVGDLVDFSVTQAVVVDGVTIIEKGAPARAHITTAKKNGRWGKAGKLEWAMKDVMTVDGNRIPIRFTDRTVGDSKGGTVAVAAVATTVLLGPVGLLWGLKKGKEAVIPAGNRYSVFVHGDTTVKGRNDASVSMTP